MNSCGSHQHLRVRRRRHPGHHHHANTHHQAPSLAVATLVLLLSVVANGFVAPVRQYSQSQQQHNHHQHHQQQQKQQQQQQKQQIQHQLLGRNGLGHLKSSTLVVMEEKTTSSSTSSYGTSRINKNKKRLLNPLLDPWRESDFLRKSDLEKEVLEDFFATRRNQVAQRLFKVSATLMRARRSWIKDRDGDALCAYISSLGPVAVKIGQTLSQRPDIVGDLAAETLQKLQTNNVAYENELAYAVMEEAFGTSYLAPGIGEPTSSSDLPLFRSMTKDPVACASLGQVYKGELYDGREVAIKVQRPDAMAILALDAFCFRFVFSGRTTFQKWRSMFFQQQSGEEEDNASIEERMRGKQNVGTVIDRVARDILDELDYNIEAANNYEFRESLSFLGFVTTPSVVDEYTTERVIVTEWVQGQHLNKLTKQQGLAMTRMAVEACTASLVLTGLVHADPHEGNLMLHDDGRVVFLDFGLMSRVEQYIMEGFARGIQGCMAEDYVTVTEAFVDVGFVLNPIMHRCGTNETWTVDPNYGLYELAAELREAMEETEGGKARFGALATVLNRRISPRWLVFTPPFVLLLVRTFLTLEGIAAKLDPTFNIYEMALPWAVRRTLSPSTQKGIEALRNTLMTPDNRIQWKRLLELTLENEGITPESVEREKQELQQQQREEDLAREAAKNAAMNDAVGSLLGSTEGKALRRALRDLDTPDLLARLSSIEGRQIVQKAAELAATSMTKKTTIIDTTTSTDAAAAATGHHAAAPFVAATSHATTTPATATTSTATSMNDLVGNRPTSPESAELKEKRKRWRKKVTWMLIKSHVKNRLGILGMLSMMRLMFRFVRLTCMEVIKTILFNRRNNNGEQEQQDSSLGTVATATN